MHFFAKVEEFSQALASAQGEFVATDRANALQAQKRRLCEFRITIRSLIEFIQTNEATEKATELGFTPDIIDGTAVFKRQVEVATGRIVTAVCILT